MTRTQHWKLPVLFLCLVFFLSFLVSAQAEAEAAPEQLSTLRTCLVRSGPSAGYPVIGQMEDGTAVTVLNQRGDYYKIDCYDMTGYIPTAQVARRENGEYYILCDPASAHTGELEYTGVAEALLLRAAVLELANRQLGAAYVYGAARPGAFDCSGLTSYVYGHNGSELQRGASGQMEDGLIISREGLQVGDLIFFRTPGSPDQASHVGIYAGNNQIIHAGNNGVCYADLGDIWFAENYRCARRIITVRADTLAPTPVSAAQTPLGGKISSIRSAR